MNAPGRTRCTYCEAPLDPHEAVKGVCKAPRCQMQRVHKAGRAVFQRDWQTYVDKQRRAVEMAASELTDAAGRLSGEGLGGEGLAIGVVPRQERPLVPLPAERRTEFTAALEETVAKAFAEGPPDPAPAATDRGEGPEEPLIDATCATCQGKCCILGGPGQAFLTSGDIQRLRQRQPGISAEAARDHYLGRLPARSVEHSCVYHGATGCVLDRVERADICNSYHCNPQTQLLQRMRQSGRDAAIIVAHEGDAGPVVATFSAGTGRQTIAPRPDGAVRADVVAAALDQIPPDLPKVENGGGRAVRTCDWCGQPIDPHLAVTTRCCGRPDCEERRMTEIGARVTRQKHERYVARQKKVIAAAGPDLRRAAERLGTAPADVPVGVVPYQNRPVEPLPAVRRAEFAAHLADLARVGFAEPDPESYHDPHARALIDPPETAIADACCATCQGSCCSLGAESHAFLNKYDVCRFRLTRADPDEAGFVAHYLDRLPEASVRGACVYQTATGCALPRTERASLCNSFQCKGLKMLVEAFDTDGRGRAVILAHQDARPRAVGVFTVEDGWVSMEQDAAEPDP